MKFSVLIPVYNVEKYLRDCLDSVLQQEFTDFEVILVNDGSTDGSKAICEEYSKNDSRIRFFDKKNEGLLLTRRYSINRAMGDYLVFLDSDDYMEHNLLVELNKTIEEKNPDIILYRYRRISDSGKNLGDDIGVMPNNSFFDSKNKDSLLLYIVSSSRLNPLWTKCIRSQIVDKEEDYSSFMDKYGEDLLQSIVPILNANTILYLDEVFVNYRKSSTGMGRNFKEKYVDDFEVVRGYVLNKLKEYKVSKGVIQMFYIGYLETMMSFLVYLVDLSSNINEFKMRCQKFQEFEIYQEAAKCVQLSDFRIKRAQRDYRFLMNQEYKWIYIYYKCKVFIKDFLRGIIRHFERTT